MGGCGGGWNGAHKKIIRRVGAKKKNVCGVGTAHNKKTVQSFLFGGGNAKDGGPILQNINWGETKRENGVGEKKNSEARTRARGNGGNTTQMEFAGEWEQTVGYILEGGCFWHKEGVTPHRDRRAKNHEHCWGWFLEIHRRERNPGKNGEKKSLKEQPDCKGKNVPRKKKNQMAGKKRETRMVWGKKGWKKDNKRVKFGSGGTTKLPTGEKGYPWGGGGGKKT